MTCFWLEDGMPVDKQVIVLEEIVPVQFVVGLEAYRVTLMMENKRVGYQSDTAEETSYLNAKNDLKITMVNERTCQVVSSGEKS